MRRPATGWPGHSAEEPGARCLLMFVWVHATVLYRYGMNDFGIRIGRVDMYPNLRSHGNYEFEVMPVGLCVSPSTFQYLMDETFHENVGQSAALTIFVCFKHHGWLLDLHWSVLTCGC